MITKHTIEEHADSLARYYPSGNIFEAKFIAGTLMRAHILGLASGIAEKENYLKLLQDEFLPDKTVLLLDEWERFLGIPDDCFQAESDPDIRRTHILVKLASLGVQTVEDFQAVADIFGFSVTVIPGSDYGGPEAGTPEEARNTIVLVFSGPVPGVNVFPFVFPINFSDEQNNIVACLFNKLKPATSRIVTVSI